jgi:hypothetical protein
MRMTSDPAGLDFSLAKMHLEYGAGICVDVEIHLSPRAHNVFLHAQVRLEGQNGRRSELVTEALRRLAKRHRWGAPTGNPKYFPLCLLLSGQRPANQPVLSFAFEFAREVFETVARAIESARQDEDRSEPGHN